MALWGNCLPSTFRLHVVNPKSWTERIFVISARVCLVGNHQQEYFVGQLPDKHGFYFGRGQHRCSKWNFSPPREWWDRGLHWRTDKHPFQTQLFRRGQFNPTCLQSGRFYGNFERRLIGHERHHEKIPVGTESIWAAHWHYWESNALGVPNRDAIYLLKYVLLPPLPPHISLALYTKAWLVSASISPASSQ